MTFVCIHLRSYTFVRINLLHWNLFAFIGIYTATTSGENLFCGFGNSHQHSLTVIYTQCFSFAYIYIESQWFAFIDYCSCSFRLLIFLHIKLCSPTMMWIDLRFWRTFAFIYVYWRTSALVQIRWQYIAFICNYEHSF